MSDKTEEKIRKPIPKKVWIPLVCVLCALILGGVILLLCLPKNEVGSPETGSSAPSLQAESRFPDSVIRDPEKDRGRFTGYTHIVVAEDTPKETIKELEQYGVKPIQFENNDSLFAPDNPEYLAEVGAKTRVYLCEGTYEMRNGSFLILDEKTPVFVSGAGKDKTKLLGGTKSKKNSSPAIFVRGSEQHPVKGAQFEQMTIEGFEYGLRIQRAEKLQFSELHLLRNHFVGLSLEAANNCTVDKCIFEENGLPMGNDTGYGLSLLLGSKGNKGKDNLYQNNANKNAIDFFARGFEKAPKDNAVEMKFVYDLKRTERPFQDPDNIQPTEKSIRVEMETGEVDGKGAVVVNQAVKVKPFTGDGYVFLFNTSIKLKVNLPKAGNYRLFVVGTSDDGNNKCDFVQINGGKKFLTSYLGKNKSEWTFSQPGIEIWENNELHPKAPKKGFAFNEGENEILITANWGYCCYDAVILEPLD